MAEKIDVELNYSKLYTRFLATQESEKYWHKKAMEYKERNRILMEMLENGKVTKNQG